MAMSKYYRLQWSSAKQVYLVFERMTGKQVSPGYQTAREAAELIRALEYDMEHPS